MIPYARQKIHEVCRAGISATTNSLVWAQKQMAPDRWKHSEQRKKGGIRGTAMTKLSKSSPKREYPSMSAPLFPLCFTPPPTLKAKPSIPAHFCWHTITAQIKKIKKESLFVCGGTAIWPWMLASMWQLARKQKQARKQRKCVAG